MLHAGVSTNSTGISALEVTVAVPSPAGVSAPRLTGHTTGTANNTGLINVTDFVIVAEAEDYILSFTLTDFPMVRLLMPHEHECTCANQLRSFHEPRFHA